MKGPTVTGSLALRWARVARVAAVATAFLAAVSATAGSPAGAPPLLDRELFFGNPEITAARLSPDGRSIAFLKPWKNTRNIWVKGTEEPFEKARLVTAEAGRPVPDFFFWTRDSRSVVFGKDASGDGSYNAYAVDTAGVAEPGQDAPRARQLTNAKGSSASIYALPRSDPDVIDVGMNDRDPAWPDLYAVKMSTGQRTLVQKNTERVSEWFFDLDGRLRLALRTTDKGDTELLRVEQGGFARAYSCSVFESCRPLRFHKDGKRVYLRTNKGEADLVRLALLDPATGREELVESDPLGRVDLGGAVFSEATDDLIATWYDDERVRFHFRDKGFEADFRWLQEKHPGLDLALDDIPAADGVVFVTASGDTEPGQRFVFKRKTRQILPQYRTRERIPREHMAEVKPIRYPSADGLEIPAFITLPVGVAAKSLPLVVLVHGGPWARDSRGFNDLTQFLANRGYAVLRPNFRASAGYGKRFLNAGNREWGGKMQDDLTWGVKHLVAQGIADPRRVGMMGVSYGGYATLAGLAFTPDVYAAGVSISGPSNLVTLLANTPPALEWIRTTLYERMGDPRTPEGERQLQRQSPRNSVDRIRAPLLVAQGAMDFLVTKAEADLMVIALRDRGLPVEYLVAPDEAHTFVQPANNMALYAAVEAFFARHLGGRHQTSMSAAVAARLKAITVDPATLGR